MALRPVDLQNIINTSIEVAKVAQTRNDTPNMHQGEFAIQLQKEAEEKKEQVQKGQGHNAEETKVKDERERKNGYSSERKKEREKKEKEQKTAPNSTLLTSHDKIKHIDIKV